MLPLDQYSTTVSWTSTVQSLRTGGAEIVVLSDGYGFYAEEICEGQDLAHRPPRYPSTP